MEHLDKQMQRYSSKLRDDLNIPIEASNALASAIFSEVREMSHEVQKQLMSAAPIALSDQLEELSSFQAFTEYASSKKEMPFIARANVIVQNYICFVYLNDNCLKILRKQSKTTITQKCCKYLTNNPVRAFRNALAHGNWKYNTDFTGLLYFAHKGDNPDGPMTEFEVSQQELDFWHSLTKCTLYSIFTALTHK